jgi:hypothetical protein
VLVVVVAIDLLDLGNSGVGYLNSAIGVGGVLAAVAAAAVLVGVRRLSLPFLVGAAVWAGPLIAVAAFVNPAFAIVMFGFVGLGATITDVTAHTLLQRAVPNAILGRVYGVMAMFWLVAIGVGAVVTPAIIRSLGKRWTLVAAGLFMQVLLLAFGPRLVRIDAAANAPAAERLDMLRAINIFAPLSGLVLEQLAQQLIDVEEPAGTAVIVEGDPGDRFYIIAAGEVDVTKDEVHVARLGPGDYFGEIALLRDVPRTATCTAATDARLFALEREDFLAAVTGHPGSVQAAEGVVSSRLAGLQTATTAGVMARPARL